MRETEREKRKGEKGMKTCEEGDNNPQKGKIVVGGIEWRGKVAKCKEEARKERSNEKGWKRKEMVGDGWGEKKGLLL